MLPTKLLNENYYYDKLSMMLKSSYGVTDIFAMLITVLVLVDDAIDDILEMLDISDDATFVKIYNADDTNASDILDKFAHLYGVERNFTMKYHDDDDSDPSSITIANLSLNNFELWMLIKGQILQNQFNGSYIQTVEYYSRMHLPIKIISAMTAANAYVYLKENAQIEIPGIQTLFSITDNIKAMFKAGLFTIKSLGIKYMHTLNEYSFLYYKQDADVGTSTKHGWGTDDGTSGGVWDR